MKIIKDNLPWVASVAVLLFLGANFVDRDTFQFGTATPEVAEVVPVRAAVQPESTLDEIAAVAPSTTAQELTAIIQEAAEPEVTRTAPLETSIAPLIEPEPEVQEIASGPTIADDPAAFFASAQANLATDDACGDDLRALAAEARIYFPSGGLSGADAGLAQARLLSKVLAECPGYILQVEGHSDPSGDPQINLALSKQRAEAVVSRIASAGIDVSRLVPVGYGDQRPSNVRGTQDPAYYDRRVEFTVVAQEQTQLASFSTTSNTWQPTACATDLVAVADRTKVYYAPRSITVPSDDLRAVMQLAVQAANCNGAKLRIVGQHLGDAGTRESITTGRHRALAIMNTLVAAGSWSEAIPGQPGLPNSRVDFQIVATQG